MRVNNDVTAILSASTFEGLLLFLPDGQLDRKMYMAVNKVLTDLGGKWNRAKKAHVFTIDPADIIDEICITGEYTTRKKELQFFETPDKLAAELVEMADIQDGETVLEPSAGHGRIARLIPNVRAVEIDSHNCHTLLNIGINPHHGDFLEYNEKADVIVANPPFTKQQDVDHVTHMIELANRRVVAVMSASVMYRENKKTLEFKELVDQYEHEFIELDEGVFKESGTNVKTVILVLTKS
tara:strand:- start:15074 stop:15790 length:717 start_codon:yes stop_codon:yes gene_type:complete